ncbi:hypothetical protein Egran_03915 [Elaphomyces granulatus]|uniref:Rpr2-domain-containing protein n=1 Tax=Elaphomyces granulatus TaxID=519963 RepID=A0A232LVZ3_9EURO|nr:hypothetical protein Egran_03915 [Elaphomyces granulatus]
MGKTKGKTSSPGSHLRARIEYLHQAAVYLQSASTRTSGLDAASTGTNEGNQERVGIEGEALQLPNAKPTAPDPIMCPSNQAKDPPTARDLEERRNQTKKTRPSGLSRLYISQMRGVSLKSQHRLPRLIKRSFCKRCDTLLAPGLTCTEEIRNESRERKKPWADILVIRCTACGTEKRFPQTQKRSKRLAARREENKGV